MHSLHHFVLALWGDDFAHISSQNITTLRIDSLLDATENVDGFIIGANMDVDECLMAIRQNPRWTPYPVWTQSPHPLADGVWTDSVGFERQGSKTNRPEMNCSESGGSESSFALLLSTHEHLMAVRHVQRDDAMMATLHYLWARPDSELTPVRDISASSMYRYPLLAAICSNDDLADIMLKRLSINEFLVADQLHDRVPLCPQCASGHLVFAESCPACHSIDIVQSHAIHCFVCGHVGLENSFRQTGQMICPSCNTTLRLIGSDYDRPIENWACRQCGELFIEADNRAHCISCAHLCTPSQLQQKQFSAWKLSDKGKQVCRHGHSTQAAAIFDTLDLVRPEAFHYALGWLIRYADRYSDSPYCLVLLEIHQLDALIAKIGIGRALSQLDAFIEHFSAQIRSTDFLMRSNETRLWLALPRTSATGLSAFSGKLSDWLGQQQAGHEFVLDIRWVSYCSNAESVVIHDINTLFERLSGQLS